MREDIVALIKEAGIVGAGGAGFPTHVKVSAPAEVVIVNGAECEPLLRVDQQLMQFEAAKVVKGLEAVMEATGASQGVIALKAKYKAAKEALTEEIKGRPVKLFTLGDFYPAGDEHVTVYEVVKRVVPEGGIPLKVNCVVSNVETLINIANALEGAPVTDSYLTVTGEVPKPITVKLPIGTSIAEALALAGLKDLAGKVVIEGGPMMGKVVADVGAPITKTTKGVIVLPEAHPLVQRKKLSLAHQLRRSKAACIQCSRCTDVCPRYTLGHRLQPHKIMCSLNYLRGDEQVVRMSLLCSECGACEYGCPMELSPRQVNTALKQELAQKGIKLESASQSPVPELTREYKKIPVKRLIIRMGLTRYDCPAPLTEVEYKPKTVTIPLRQHIGAPAEPTVDVGEWVEKGAGIARTKEGALGANIHASISGVITAITDCIVIETRDREAAKEC